MVSIIVPVYNSEKYVKECINSILNQTYSDLELILVENGSTDRSRILCKEFEKEDPRVILLTGKNKGVSAARNKGLRIAQGEFIMFCDSDDLYDPHYIESMILAYKKEKSDLVISNYRVFYEEYSYNQSPIAVSSLNRDDVLQRIFSDNSIGGFVWNKFFPRKVIENIYFDEDLAICEDLYFVCRVLKNIKTISYVNNKLYLYREHNQSAIKRIDNMFDKNDNLKYSISMRRLITNNVVPEKYWKKIYAAEFLFAVSVRCDYLIQIKNPKKSVLNNLKILLKEDYQYFFHSKDYSNQKKIITLLNSLINIRKLKHVFLSK